MQSASSEEHAQSTSATAQFRTVLDCMAEAVYCVDQNRVINFWNASAAEITGYREEEVLGRSCRDDVLVHCDQTGKVLCHDGCPLTATLLDGRKRELEAFLKHKEGHRVAVRIRSAPLSDADGRITGVVESFSQNGDKLAAVELADLYRKLALTDTLTGIGNRREAQVHLEESVRRHMDLQVPICISLLDIDRFKQVNDSYGHDAGDKVLKVVSATLRNALRASDFLGRWGGEEFLMILEGCRLDDASAIAEQCRALVEQSRTRLDSGELGVTISVGLTEIRSGDTSGAALRRADQLLYASKCAGRNRVSREASDSRRCGAT